MASDIVVHGRPGTGLGAARHAVDAALAVFTTVDATCSRFRPDSPLVHMNTRPDRWHVVPAPLYRALREAHRAYERTKGRFDPRILQDLEDLGYDRSLPFEEGPVRTRGPGGLRSGRRPPGKWRPRFRGGPRPQVHPGGAPIDLGGIGKGLAVRWAAEELDGVLGSYLIDAGGDCLCRGPGTTGRAWRVGVEDPRGGDGPLAVLELADLACATSSVRLRRWTAGGRAVHHLIDPRTGRPGGHGLLSVTVVDPDPAEAEVLSKSLFLAGGAMVGTEARRRNVAASWVTVDGTMSESPRIAPYVLWRSA
ncbi:MAG TPA: FAD:protein FMN transferase [Acidimicrobiales bacterium]|nr:FAD:protein FMN transferase [Acidimicrobiales bacterium]